MSSRKDLKSRFYPIMIHRVVDEDDIYYLAFLPDFGEASCSAVGDTIEGAIRNLEHVKSEVISYYIESGKMLPDPSVLYLK